MWMDVGVSAGAGMGWDPECVWNGFRLNYSVLCLFGGGGAGNCEFAVSVWVRKYEQEIQPFLKNPTLSPPEILQILGILV